VVPIRFGVVDQRCAVEGDGVDHRVPVATGIVGDLSDAATMEADLERRSPPGTISDRRSWRGDPLIGLGERHHPTRRVRAAPALLAPHKPRVTPEARQICKARATSPHAQDPKRR
jgi:hypothetical protein